MPNLSVRGVRKLVLPRSGRNARVGVGVFELGPAEAKAGAEAGTGVEGGLMPRRRTGVEGVEVDSR